jgi:tetratricopeptide (TPR) repeat protein
MTGVQSSPATPGQPAKNRVPWLVGAAALVLFCWTVNPWLSLLNLQTVARVSGWEWRPALGQPVASALFYVFHWLPPSALPVALNLFTAVCAAGVLMLLSRSVALLPHDITPDGVPGDNRSRSVLSTSAAWLPPVLAAVLCGLQLTFWEHATSASGELIDLLLVAYALRCLLEFRLDPNPAWLLKSMAVYGAGMANTWALWGLCPVYLLTLLRTAGLAPFVDRRLRLRLALCGIAGLSLCLLPPLIAALRPARPMGFWTALAVQSRSQLAALLSMRSPAFAAIALLTLVTVLVLSIRWKSHTVQLGDDSALGVFITKATGHFVHGLFLVLPIWLALNPTLGHGHLALRTPLLTFHYLSALVFGYCAGYFLIFDPGAIRKRIGITPAAAGCLLVCALTCALLWRHLGQIRITNGPALREFARELLAGLPDGPSVALSEDPRLPVLLHAEIAAGTNSKAPILLDTSSLPSSSYQAFMAARFASRWPAPAPTNESSRIPAAGILSLVSAFASREPLFYLHPSSGLFVEDYDEQPIGLVVRLVPSPDPRALHVPLPDSAVAANEQLWQARWAATLGTLADETKAKPGPVPGLGWLGLWSESNDTALTLGRLYSKALNDWGVRLQRLERWEEAGTWFERAIELNPDNLSALINASYNTAHRHGDPARLDPDSFLAQFHDRFAKFDDWGRVLGADGPVDEPTFLLKTGRVFFNAENPRQAARAFERCADLAPGWPLPKIWLAQSYLRLREPAKALEVTGSLEALIPNMSALGLADYLQCRATALTRLQRTNEVAGLIAAFVRDHGEHGEVLAAAADLNVQIDRPEDALTLWDALLKREPGQVDLLVKKGRLQLQLSRRNAAIDTLSQALSFDPANEAAHLYRAIANLESGRLDAARGDYLEVLKSPDHSELALFGLGGIAWRRHDTNSAIDYYEQYLTNAAPRSAKYRLVLERLRQLKARQP